jgi:hypothetical protein
MAQRASLQTPISSNSSSRMQESNCWTVTLSRCRIAIVLILSSLESLSVSTKLSRLIGVRFCEMNIVSVCEFVIQSQYPKPGLTNTQKNKNAHKKGAAPLMQGWNKLFLELAVSHPDKRTIRHPKEISCPGGQQSCMELRHVHSPTSKLSSLNSTEPYMLDFPYWYTLDDLPYHMGSSMSTSRSLRTHQLQ